MSVWKSLEPASSTVVPGAAVATCTLRVHNGGDTVEEYQQSAGPLACWCRLTPGPVAPLPADEGGATTTNAVPRTAEALAGPAPFGVRLIPRVHPELSDVAEGIVTVTPSASSVPT